MGLPYPFNFYFSGGALETFGLVGTAAGNWAFFSQFALMTNGLVFRTTDIWFDDDLVDVYPSVWTNVDPP